MVNNYDRIYAEIERHAARMAPRGLASSTLVDLIMEVVDLEDRQVARIKQKVENSVRSVAVGALRPDVPLQEESSEEGAAASDVAGRGEI